MARHELTFADINILDANLAEIVVHEGVEMDKSKFDEFIAFLATELQAPYGVLVNKINSYTYTFDLQQQLSAVVGIKATAVVTYSVASKSSTQMLKMMAPEPSKWNMQIFTDRNAALNWLVAELSEASAAS